MFTLNRITNYWTAKKIFTPESYILPQRVPIYFAPKNDSFRMNNIEDANTGIVSYGPLLQQERCVRSDLLRKSNVLLPVSFETGVQMLMSMVQLGSILKIIVVPGARFRSSLDCWTK